MNAALPPRLLTWCVLTFCLAAPPAFADGKVSPPPSYRGSLEERAQEAIIIFNVSR
jgi:hypothetical protein